MQLLGQPVHGGGIQGPVAAEEVRQVGQRDAGRLGQVVRVQPAGDDRPAELPPEAWLLERAGPALVRARNSGFPLRPPPQRALSRAASSGLSCR